MKTPDSAIKTFTSEEISKALGLPDGALPISFRRVNWTADSEEKWEIEVGFEKGQMPRGPEKYTDLNDYAGAYRKYVRALFKYKENKDENTFPYEPLYIPNVVQYLATELERARRNGPWPKA